MNHLINNTDLLFLLSIDRRMEIQRLYDLTIGLLERANEDYKKTKEAYGDAAERVTTLTEIADALRNMLDS